MGLAPVLSPAVDPLCAYPKSKCGRPFMPIGVHTARPLPASSPLFLFWGVCAQRGGSSFRFCLSLSYCLPPLPHALASLRLSPSLSNLFLPLPASRCPGTLGDWGSGFSSLSTQGLEELVLSEMNSPSRTQTGDSSSVSSFSYREILREKESSTVPARVRGREESTVQLLLPQF